MLSPERKRELTDLVDALCEGSLADPQAARLCELTTNDEALRFYLAYLHTHGLLHLRHAGSEAVAQPAQPRRRVLSLLKPLRWQVAAAVAAGLLLAVVAWYALRPAHTELFVVSGHNMVSHPAYGLLEKRTGDGDWTRATTVVSGEQVRVVGDFACALSPHVDSRLNLAPSLTLAPGMTGELLTPESGERLRFKVTSGRADFNLESSSRSYVVVTPAGLVRVLGTRFSVDVKPGAESRLSVCVHSGKVQVENEFGRVFLDAGQALEGTARIDPATRRLAAGDLVFVRHGGHPEFGVPVFVNGVDERGVRYHVPNHDEQRVPIDQVHLVRPIAGSRVEVTLKRDGHFEPATILGAAERRIEIRAGQHTHKVLPEQIRLKLDH